jgi:excisionase family DNA binding protein
MDKKSEETNTYTQLLRANQVAKRLNVSLAMAYHLMQCGDIPTIRFNRTVRVREFDLDLFIQKHHCSLGNGSYIS